MAALPYMQLYVADYLADTIYLDVIESGAYLHLLMNYWQTGKPLPNDDRKLAIIAKCTTEQWCNVRSTVVEYFVEQDDKLYHDRVEADLEKVRLKSKQASDAGKKSAAKRRENSKTFNGRLTSAEIPLNHTDTDTNTENKKSTAIADFRLPDQDKVNNGSSKLVDQILDDLCLELYTKKIFPTVNSFKDKMLKQGKNPRAIIHTLSRCYQKGISNEGFAGSTPWGYCFKIMSVENGNYNESDHNRTT